MTAPFQPLTGATDVPRGWVLMFPPPAPLINLNDRKQWFERQPLKVAWRDAAHIHARQAIIKKTLPADLSGVALIFDFPVQSVRVRRDPHNFIPTVKACVDGMVAAKLFVDDSNQHVEIVDSWFHPRSDNPTVIIHIRKKTP